MNNKTYLLTYLFTLLGGVLLVCLKGRGELFSGISIVLGVVFLLIGVLTMVGNLSLSKTAREAGMKTSPAVILVSVASMVLGLIMVLEPGVFVKYVIYLIGLLLILCGVVQLFNFLPSMRRLGFSWYFLPMPIVSIGVGITVMVLGPEVANILALLTGIVMIVYSINGFAGYFYRMNLIKSGGPTGHVVDID